MGAYTLLQDLTVGTNSTSVVLNDFGTITKDDFVKVVTTFTNVFSGGSIDIYVFGNNETSNSNYHTQRLGGVNTTVFATRENVSRMRLRASSTATSFSYLKLSENNRLNMFHSINEGNDSSLITSFYYTTSSGATFASGITSLTFTAEVASSIGTGSRIQIYKLDAEKVADITVASNTTQVDISNLSIDKDSEYLLVSNSIRISSGSVVSIFPNDLTTSTQYYTQNIRGTGTSATAGRDNLNYSIASDSFGPTISYSYIKISNIGAFTVQSYNIVNAEGNGPDVQNNFVSSTYENLTMITKLSLKKDSGNIETGTRYELYKLYE